MGIVISTDFIILALIAATPLLLALLWPFFLSRQASESSQHAHSAHEALLIQRDAIYKTIRDLDFDHETGKLTDEDYHTQREMWIERGVQTLKALDAQGYAGAPDDHKPRQPDGLAASTDLDAEIEAAVRSRRSTA